MRAEEGGGGRGEGKGLGGGRVLTVISASPNCMNACSADPISEVAAVSSLSA